MFPAIYAISPPTHALRTLFHLEAVLQAEALAGSLIPYIDILSQQIESILKPVRGDQQLLSEANRKLVIELQEEWAEEAAKQRRKAREERDHEERDRE